MDLLIIARNLPLSSVDRQAFFNKILLMVEEPLRRKLRVAGFFPHLSAMLKTPEEAGRVPDSISIW